MLVIRRKTDEMVRLCQILYAVETCLMNEKNVAIFLKITIHFLLPCKGYSLYTMVSLGQKLKMQKTCEKPFYKNTGVGLCKKLFQTTPNIREMTQFSKSPIFQRL